MLRNSINVIYIEPNIYLHIFSFLFNTQKTLCRINEKLIIVYCVIETDIKFLKIQRQIRVLLKMYLETYLQQIKISKNTYFNIVCFSSIFFIS